MKERVKMRKKISMMFALVLILSLFAGCGVTQPSNPAGTSAATSGQTSAAEPKRTDVNISVAQALTTVDPHGTTYVADRITLWQIYEGLTFYNELTGEIEPRLAESWTVSDDGTVYTFKLRQDAYFHNGDPVKASDAAFSINRCTEKERPIYMYGTNIEGATAIDDYTLEVKLSASYAPFLINSTMLFIISEREVKEQGDAFGTKVTGAGTGPYKLSYLDADERITLESFDKYYSGEASIKTVNIYPIFDSAAGLISFESGDLDWYNCTVTDYLRIKDEGKFNSEATIANHMSFVAINPQSKHTALADERVRKAIAYAINKDECNYAAFDGYGEVADYLENPNKTVGAPKGDVVYNYDPDKCQQLLAEAGYPNGVDVGTILCFTGNHFEVMATVIQSQLEKVGIHAELEWAEQATTLNRGRAKDYDIFVTGGNCSGDYDNLRKRFYTPQMALTYVDFTKTEYDWQWMDNMIDAASATADPEKRLEMNKELNDYFMNTATYLPILHKCVPYVWNKDLNIEHNCPVNPIIYNWSWS